MSSAKALSALLAKTYPLDIRIVDFYERVVPHLDPFRRLMGKSVDDFYNQHCLNKPYGGVLASVLLNGVSSIGVMLQNKIERALIREFEAYSPDLVVSVTPHINRFVVRAANCLNIPTSIMVTALSRFLDTAECAKRIGAGSGAETDTEGPARALRASHAASGARSVLRLIRRDSR